MNVDLPFLLFCVSIFSASLFTCNTKVNIQHNIQRSTFSTTYKGQHSAQHKGQYSAQYKKVNIQQNIIKTLLIIKSRDLIEVFRMYLGLKVVFFYICIGAIIKQWFRVREVPGSIPSQGSASYQRRYKMVPVVRLLSTQH